MDPQLSRLEAENKALRSKLSVLDSAIGSMNKGGGSFHKKQDLTGKRSLLRTSSASFSEPFDKSKLLQAAATPMESLRNCNWQSPETSSDEEDSNSHVKSTVAYRRTPPPISSEMVLRLAEIDEDSTSRTWVYIEKMAKEVKELLHARKILAIATAQMRTGDGSKADQQRPSFTLRGETAPLRAPAVTVEPQVIDELLQNTNDALGMAQTIIDSHGSTSQLHWSTKDDRGITDDDLATSAPPHARGAQGTRTKGRGLGSVSEDGDGYFTPITRSASIPSGPDSTDKGRLRSTTQKVKHLHGTLDLVNSAYNEVYDEFQRLREEYESRLEECQFFELQCSRLDLHCHTLTERLHGNGDSVRAGMGSFSATGFAPASSLAQQRRSFSLSSLHDVSFWEQRFQELSGLTGIDEADKVQQSDVPNKRRARKQNEKSAPLTPGQTRRPPKRAG